MTRKPLILIPLIALFIALIAGAGLLLTGNSSILTLPIAPSPNQLRIISMNVSADNVLSSSFQDNIILTQAHIIVIIEWTGNNLQLDRFIKAGYHVILNHPRKKVHGICILSKLPGPSTIIEAPIKTPCTLPLGQFRFTWQQQSITLFAIHAPPPVPSCKGTTSGYVQAIAQWIDQGKLSSNIGIGKQADHVILAGDFNSLPFNEGLQKIRDKHLTDTYSKYSMNAPTWKPFKLFPYLAKIDYIFFPHYVTSASSQRFSISHSDHLGLLSDISF